MSDSRLGYSRGLLDQLRASHAHLSPEELLDLVCHLTKTYVLDQTIPFDIPLPERAEELRADPPYAPDSAIDADLDDAPELRFARLIQGLKRRTSLPQLSGFSTVNGRAVLIVDNQKITFGERVTVEFVPRAGNTPAPAPASDETRRAPGATSAAPPTAPTAPTAPTERPAPRRPGAPPERTPRPTPPPTIATEPAAPEDDGYDASVERFKRLDLD